MFSHESSDLLSALGLVLALVLKTLAGKRLYKLETPKLSSFPSLGDKQALIADMRLFEESQQIWASHREEQIRVSRLQN